MSSGNALLVLDVQKLLVDWYPGSEKILAPIGEAAARVRGSGGQVIFVAAAFRPSHPEVAPTNRLFAQLRDNHLLVEGGDEAALHPGLPREAGDLVVTKRRVGAFVGTDLETLLRPLGIGRLAVAGIATSGAVLSTVRAATDLDYDVTVLSDCCVDGDEEVQRVLLDKVLPMTATVQPTTDWDPA